MNYCLLSVNIYPNTDTIQTSKPAALHAWIYFAVVLTGKPQCTAQMNPAQYDRKNIRDLALESAQGV